MTKLKLKLVLSDVSLITITLTQFMRNTLVQNDKEHEKHYEHAWLQFQVWCYVAACLSVSHPFLSYVLISIS